MKIAFTGSGGVGKTTLLQELNKHLKYPVIREGVRSWLKRNNFNNFKEMGTEDVKRMQSDVMGGKIIQEKNLPSFLSDRTTIDNLCYALRWIGSEAKDHDGWMGTYIKSAMNHAKDNYDIIFILPWNAFPIDDDGVRSNKKYYQYMIQSLIEYHCYGLMTSGKSKAYIHKIESVDLSDRVRECLLIINELELKRYQNGE